MTRFSPLDYLSALEPWMQASLGLGLLLLAAVAARLIALWAIAPTLQRLRLRAGAWPTEILLHERVLSRLGRMLPWLVLSAGVQYVPHLNASFGAVLSNIALAFIAIQIVAALMAMLDALLWLQERYSREKGDQASAHKMRSIKSYVQLGKLMLILAGAIVSVAVLLDRSPLIVLSGLGAMSAVLMLVFKDTILSFTAGVQLSSNDMLRIGDWIEMPQVGADGDVIDIALHTVKVQNWDKTITTIPTWRLMSESYRNWRGMSESGGRRIKRPLQIDVNSVRFLVRTLEPTAEGVPLEVYCFTATTKWAVYEGIQGDIFDHLLAVLPEFGLRLYQHPSGHDFRALLPLVGKESNQKQ